MILHRQAMAASSEGNPAWQTAKAESTAIRVERQIKEAVLDGQYSPGDFLGSENDLAAKFGVSRLPIREALGRLRALGVVEIKTGAGGGVRIAAGNAAPAVEALAIQLKLSGITDHEVFDAQLAIETAAVELAARAATEEDLVRMEAAIEVARGLVNSSDEFTHASLVFHQCVVDAAHNHVLSATMKAIVYALYRSLNVNTTPTVSRRVIERHRKLLAAIRARDADEARELISVHLASVRTKYFATVASEA